MWNVTREAKTREQNRKDWIHVSNKKKYTKEARHKLNVSYFDHLIEISISKSNK